MDELACGNPDGYSDRETRQEEEGISLHGKNEFD